MFTFARDDNKLRWLGSEGSFRLLGLILLSAILAGCTGGSGTSQGPSASSAPSDPNRKIRIGFSMATLKEERWQRDHDAFQAHCLKLDIECVITVANGDANRQANDVENLLTRGIDVLVIAPHDATQAASMVECRSVILCLRGWTGASR